ncbi:hypothetical protein AVEN_78596-1 [Araneus ventricosus]|uniref:Uncharacterized protein n=1 Tax=Araneus ventricosus TaxID=182803 RepID=A0A4Y2G3L9_ARAVE|nr:hypothetical protein AVEN_78596-1 [Araneus ventricosus]
MSGFGTCSWYLHPIIKIARKFSSSNFRCLSNSANCRLTHRVVLGIVLLQLKLESGVSTLNQPRLSIFSGIIPHQPQETEGRIKIYFQQDTNAQNKE